MRKIHLMFAEMHDTLVPHVRFWHRQSGRFHWNHQQPQGEVEANRYKTTQWNVNHCCRLGRIMRKDQERRLLFWCHSGQAGSTSNPNQWFQQIINFDVNESGNIFIEGTRGNSYYSDIAIDDVTVSNQCVSTNTRHFPVSGTSECVKFLPFKITVLGVLQDGTTTSQQYFSCDFNVDTCSQALDIVSNFNADSQFDWTRWSGCTPTSGTGPCQDRTAGSTGKCHTFAACG